MATPIFHHAIHKSIAKQREAERKKEKIEKTKQSAKIVSIRNGKSINAYKFSIAAVLALGVLCRRQQQLLQKHSNTKILNNNTHHVVECSTTIHILNNLLFQSMIRYDTILCRPLHNRNKNIIVQTIIIIIFFSFFPFFCWLSFLLSILLSTLLFALFLIFCFSHLSIKVQLRGIFIYVMGLLAE